MSHLYIIIHSLLLSLDIMLEPFLWALLGWEAASYASSININQYVVILVCPLILLHLLLLLMIHPSSGCLGVPRLLWQRSLFRMISRLVKFLGERRLLLLNGLVCKWRLYLSRFVDVAWEVSEVVVTFFKLIGFIILLIVWEIRVGFWLKLLLYLH